MAQAYLAGAAPKPDNHLKHGHVRPLTVCPTHEAYLKQY
jgi:hypothetical protein